MTKLLADKNAVIDVAHEGASVRLARAVTSGIVNATCGLVAG
jgi:hypothetical protein